MKLTERKLLILTIIIPGVIAIALAIYGYFIQHKNLNKIQQDIADVKNQIKDAQAKVEQMNKLEEKLEGLRKEREGMKDRLPAKTAESFEDFLNSLAQIGEDTQVLINSATVADDVKKSGPPTAGGPAQMFDKISYNVRVDGDFYQCVNFMFMLETNKRFIKIDKFTIRPTNLSDVDKKEDLAIKHTLDLKITTFCYNAPVSAAPK
jgi:Tfp pilus assembly protein PilO